MKRNKKNKSSKNKEINYPKEEKEGDPIMKNDRKK